MSRGEDNRRAAGAETGPAGLYAREIPGEGDEALVLLHGFGGSHHIWDEVIAHLDSSRPILAYDLPGHGKSLDAFRDGAAASFARMILADLDARGMVSVHLVGHSLGGAVSVLVGLFEPQRVRSMTLLAPGGFGPEINASLLQQLARSETEEDIASSLRAMAAPSFAPSETLVRQTWKERSVPGQRETLERLFARIVRDGRQGAFTAAQLATLTIPVQLVWGELDPVLPVQQAANAPADFQVKRLPGLGHMLPLEAPREMARLICGISG